jgi:hypothetical protein
VLLLHHGCDALDHVRVAAEQHDDQNRRYQQVIGNGGEFQSLIPQDLIEMSPLGHVGRFADVGLQVVEQHRAAVGADALPLLPSQGLSPAVGICARRGRGAREVNQAEMAVRV